MNLVILGERNGWRAGPVHGLYKESLPRRDAAVVERFGGDPGRTVIGEISGRGIVPQPPLVFHFVERDRIEIDRRVVGITHQVEAVAVCVEVHGHIARRLTALGLDRVGKRAAPLQTVVEKIEDEPLAGSQVPGEIGGCGEGTAIVPGVKVLVEAVPESLDGCIVGYVRDGHVLFRGRHHPPAGVALNQPFFGNFTENTPPVGGHDHGIVRSSMRQAGRHDVTQDR